ncbi:MAG: efflux RND transporter periplasmic adaptor subunit [Tepidisphaeraceae bacterium]|jgi:membrane fusion protein (multidrug efflux system)
MEPAKVVSAALKLWVLLILGGALYFLWRERAAPPLASSVEAADQIKHTDIEVRIGTIRKMTLHEYVVGFGNVEPAPATADAPAAEARVTVDWPAAVSQVRCVEGQHVDKGQTLFVAKSARLIGGTSEAGEELVTSPIGGTVVAINVHPGEAALPTATAVQIVDLDRLVMAAGIPAWQAAEISAGQTAEIEIPADPATGGVVKFESKVQRVDGAADAKTNLVSVDVVIPAGRGVRPGQFGRVSIISKEQADCLVVPADAIVRDALDRPYVGVVSEDRKQAILKPVQPGLRDGDWVQVTAEGLQPDQTIVVGGAYGLLFRSDIRVLNH